MNQNQYLRMLILATGSLLWSDTLVHAEISMGGDTTDNTISVVYVRSTGEIALDAADKELTGIQILSAAEVFDGPGPPLNLDGLLDVNPIDDNRPDKIAKAVFGMTFGAISFGNVARPGLSESLLLADLTVTGTLFPSGRFGPDGVDLVFVPEPSSRVLLFSALLLVPWLVRLRCCGVEYRPPSTSC